MTKVLNIHIKTVGKKAFNLFVWYSNFNLPQLIFAHFLFNPLNKPYANHITDESDMIFYKYLSTNPEEIRELVESHLAKCVISNKA